MTENLSDGREATPPSAFLPAGLKRQIDTIIDSSRRSFGLSEDDPLVMLAKELDGQLFSDGAKPTPAEAVEPATKLLTEVWLRVATDSKFQARGPIPDTMLDLRDTLNPTGNPDWLPDGLAERLAIR